MEQTPKTTNINGFLYSRKPFEGYTMRYKVHLIKDGKDRYIDIYTTLENQELFAEEIKNLLKPGVEFERIFHRCTIEDDRLTDKMLEELFANI